MKKKEQLFQWDGEILNWTKSFNDSWTLYHNPFRFVIFLDDDCANCIVHFGLETKEEVVKGVNGTSHLDAGKEWCLAYARKEVAELSRIFSDGAGRAGAEGSLAGPVSGLRPKNSTCNICGGDLVAGSCESSCCDEN